MGSLERKMMRTRKLKSPADGPGMGRSGTPKARIIMKWNPKTDQMQEYHLTKGWR
ncbi:hypothetical protein LAV_00117 [Sphingobium phage Lacusarx]|uniref:Uncharacterized protein n=1 Tax=Sphingobium phage Lacusarx TaxID=1980139 RepID=A0A1W6DXJ9_9CAUD|nr:hypothetical protein FDH44_gp186 [Sphingobium phage Lacusarx]ARK07492.1 hypothetical protein LAV_00117 [Sphingobium phage Lacusarx]